MLCIHRRRLIDMLVLAMLAGAAGAAAPSAVSQVDALAALKTALNQAATTAVASLGKPDGFLGLASQYNSLAAQAGKFGLVDAREASVESYVTSKALDGLYLMMAKEEKAIRQDPLGHASQLLRKVFGSLSR